MIHFLNFANLRYNWGSCDLREALKGSEKPAEGEETIEDVIASHTEITITHVILAFVTFLLIGVVAYSFVFEDWPIIDSLYFSVVTFSTVGYGDLSPSNDLSRLFTCFFAIAGIVVIGIALGAIGEKVVDSQINAIKNAADQTEKYLDPTEQGAAAMAEAEKKDQEAEEKKGWRNRLKRDISRKAGYITASLFIFFGALLVDLTDNLQEWTIIETIYYGVITTTTVGYGDYSAKSNTAKMYAVLFIPLSVGAMGFILGKMVLSYTEGKATAAQEAMKKRGLRESDLARLDADNSGEVDKLEFFEFMLVSFGRVDQETLDNLHEQFNALDEDGSGTLDSNDLKQKFRSKGGAKKEEESAKQDENAGVMA